MAGDAAFDRLYQSKWQQLRKAISLAAEHRRRVNEGDFSVFLMPLAFALVKDFFLDIIPVIGLFFGFFITVYLFIFMWGRGRMRLRLIFFFISVLDLIPIINLIPFETAGVMYGYHLAKKEAEKVKADLDGLDRAIPKMKKTLQLAAVQKAIVQAKEASEQEESLVSQQESQPASRPTGLPVFRGAAASTQAAPVMRQTAANDARYRSAPSGVRDTDRVRLVNTPPQGTSRSAVRSTLPPQRIPRSGNTNMRRVA